MALADDVLDTIISDYTREGGVRGLKKRLDTLCRIAAVKYIQAEETATSAAANAETTVEAVTAVQPAAGTSTATSTPVNAETTAEATTATQPSAGTPTVSFTSTAVVAEKHPVIQVTRENLRDFLDMHALPHNKVKASAQPGVVTGLAWTQVGGEILYIESLFTKGSGKTIITGQLGDVMKESSAIAQALVQSRFPEQAELFEKNDLHIHVPDGSTPKDGPSAGITMTTAIASLVTGIPVPPNIAMTGEVSLEGAVSAIGGLPEKLMAAERAGVQKVFIPKENIDDLRDVAAEVRDRLEIIPVESIEEVLTTLGILKHK